MSRTCRGGWRANQTSAEQPRLAPWDPDDQRTQEDTPMTKLHGQVAVITGATAGMALAAAKLFVTEGAHVYITGRRKDQLHDAVREIGGNVTGVRSDSGNPRDLDLLVDAVRAGHGRVDVLYVSAGIGTVEEPLTAVTEDSFDAVFGVNVRGALFTVQKLLPLMSNGGPCRPYPAPVSGQQRPIQTLHATPHVTQPLTAPAPAGPTDHRGDPAP